MTLIQEWKAKKVTKAAAGGAAGPVSKGKGNEGPKRKRARTSGASVDSSPAPAPAPIPKRTTSISRLKKVGCLSFPGSFRKRLLKSDS